MKEITIVTGPLRSGTSCTTGLLEKCGVDLGRTVRVLRNPTEYNPCGHYEPDLLFTINNQLIKESGNGTYSALMPPPEADVSAIFHKRSRYFQLFIKKFDGELCKDPLLCLTLKGWRQYWPELKRAVFCLRNPLAVAKSMNHRYGIELPDAFGLWQTYTIRFLKSIKGLDCFIFDFDQFCSNPLLSFAALLDWLKKPCEISILEKNVSEFLITARSVINSNQLIMLPSDTLNLYQELLKNPGRVINEYSV